MVRLSRGNVALLAVVVLAGLLVLAIDASRDGGGCDEWQERYEAAAPDGATGTFDFVNIGPLAELRAERPEGCPIPR